MSRRTALHSPPCHPCGLDPQPDRAAPIQLDGAAKQSLEVGRTRLLVTGLVFALAFFSIGVRLVEVSLLPGDMVRLTADAQANTTTQRGDIVDRNGVVLAKTLPSVSLYANPTEIRNPATVAERLSRTLPGLDETKLAARLASKRSFVWVKRNLTPRQQAAVIRLGIPGLNFQNEPIRVYPQGSLVSHAVGFTDIDSRGLAGIERAFDSSLQQGAEPVALSLDVGVQHILTEELSAAIDEFRAIGAAGLVLDVETGEILAMASLPTFDPRKPGAASKDARFNRATLGIYEMGSVFKIFTTAMALDQGVVGLNDGYDVTDPIKASRFIIRDYKPKKGWLSVPEIFMYSSNIGTVHMAMEAGTPSQQAFMRDLGLTQPLPFELLEAGQPLIPSPWREINTMTISYGHGLAVSPLQLTNAVAAMVNGGVLRPATLLKRAEGEPVPGERVISEETSEAVRWMMRLVVQHGTGRKAEAAGYLVGGKTGTADKLNGRRYARDSRISSFVAAFPMDKPRYVIFAMVDEPKGNKSTFGFATGGWVAAPVVQGVVQRMGPMMGLQPHSPEVAASIDDLMTPAAVRGFTLASD